MAQPPPPASSLPVDTDAGLADDLRRLLAVLRRRWPYLVLPALALGAVALVTGMVAAPTYLASATVEPENPRELLDTLNQRELTSQARQLGGPDAVSRAIDELGLTATPTELRERVETRQIPNTGLLQVAVTDTDAGRAARIADSLADIYLSARQEALGEELAEARDDLDQQIRALEDRLAALETSGDQGSGAQIEAITRQIAELTARLAALPGSPAELDEAGRVITAAQVPSSPTGAGAITRAVVGLLLGLGIGAGLVAAREWFDDTVHDERAVLDAAPGHPVLGRIPRLHRAPSGRAASNGATSDRTAQPTGPTRTNSVNDVQAGAGPPSVVGSAIEAAGQLHATVRGVPDSRTLRAVLVTASGPDEGASTVAACLAMAAVDAGENVLLIDADLRRRTVSRWFGRDDREGLGELVAGSVAPGDVLGAGAARPDAPGGVDSLNLAVLPAGRPGAAGPALLGSTHVREAFTELTALHDLVVIDTPPVAAVADALRLAGHVDAGLLVAAPGMTKRPALREATRALTRAEADLLGFVINGVSLDPHAASVYATVR